MYNFQGSTERDWTIVTLIGGSLSEPHLVLTMISLSIYIFFKMNKEVRMLLPKKDLIQVE